MILTDEECRNVWYDDSINGSYMEKIRQIEAKVLAKLNEDEPVGEIKHCPGGFYEGSCIPAAPYDLAVFYNGMPPAGTKLYARPSPAMKEQS